MTTLSPRAIEAAAKHIYEDKGDRKGIIYAGWDNEPESIKEPWRVDVTAAITAYLAAREAEGFVEVPANDLRAVVNLARQADDCIETECIAEYLKDRAMLTAAQNGGEDADH